MENAPLVAICGSNSSNSINRRLMHHVMGLLPAGSIREVDMRSYPLPVFGVDIEKEEGPLSMARSLRTEIGAAKGILFVLAEHNRGMTAFFKNAMDWASRSEQDFKFLAGKPSLLLGTSPGRGGATHSIEAASNTLTMLGSAIIAKLPLPSFRDNTEPAGDGLLLKDETYVQTLNGHLQALLAAVQ